MRVHGQLEYAAVRVGPFELALEDVEDFVWRGVRAQRREPVHVEVDRVVADLTGHAGVGAVIQRLSARVVVTGIDVSGSHGSASMSLDVEVLSGSATTDTYRDVQDTGSGQWR